MKTIILAGVAALAFAGSASAQGPAQGTGDIARAAAVAEAEARFAALDTDGNGELGEAEMRRMFEQRRAERAARMSPEDRARLEQRRAGRGGGAERRGGRREGQGMRGGEGGPVTLAAFRARAEQRFDRLDLDGNGVITRAEQEQLRARRGANRGGD